jgi:flavin reductase (DIM6/NTAB) family NADH-FMN oxidoreductase RutF
MSTPDWPEPEGFETIATPNKPFSLRVPALVVSRGRTGPTNIMLSMWNTPVGFDPSSFLVAIEQRCRTRELIDETGELVIAAPSERMFEVVIYAGSVSGRDEDKWAASGLTALRPTHVSVPLVAEALANLELRVSRVIPYDDSLSLYICEMLACHVRKDSFRGGIYVPGAEPLLYLGKESGLPHGDKSAARHGASLGRIFQADETSALLLRNNKT